MELILRLTHFFRSFDWKSACGLVFVLAPAGALAADEPSHGYSPIEGFSRMPYLQLPTTESIRILWRTTAAMKPSVRYGTKLDSLEFECSGDAIVERRMLKDVWPLAGPPPKSDLLPLFNAPDGTSQFEASISGLQPATRYFYAVYDGDKRLTPEDESYHFETHPPKDTKDEVLFWLAGDSGTGERRQKEVYQAMVEYVEYNNLKLDFYTHVGDMAYDNGKDAEFQERFFEMYDPTLRNVACWPALGNHEGKTSKGEFEMGPYFDCYICPTDGEAGGEPSGTEAYYAFDYANIHFIVLDSFDLDRKPTGAMAKWLRADLEKASADWLVAFWHHPPYTMGTHDSNKEEEHIQMRQHIMPILEAGGVDVCFGGHSHIYERSMLMDGAYETPTNTIDVILDDGDGDPRGDGPYRKSRGITPNNGTVQIVAGHGGQSLGRKGTMPVMKRIMVEHGSVLIQIKENTLIGTMINYKGFERDVFSIVKEGAVAPIRIAQPWERPPYKNPELASHLWRGQALPKDHETRIKRGAQWKYLAGAHPPEGWTRPTFDESGWKIGDAGFGYGDRDDKTELTDMRGKYRTLYLRKEFQLASELDLEELALAVSYDDGFIAYVNGHEIVRANVASGSGPNAEVVFSHEAEDEFEIFRLRRHRKHFVFDAPNLIAIEAHNRSLASDDFSIDPFVVFLTMPQDKIQKLPNDYEYVTAIDAEWHYLAGEDAPDGWAREDFDHSQWKVGEIGFGYGDDDDVTILDDMKDNYQRAYFRTTFKIEDKDDFERLGLALRFDDAFIAYINGREALRVGIEFGRGAKAKKIAKHDAAAKRNVFDYFSLDHMKNHLNVGGPNTIAIEGHNDDLGSSDFSSDPVLIINRDIASDMPKKYAEVIPQNAEWEYLAKKDAKPGEGWKKAGFKADGWAAGKAGFGYGNRAEPGTELGDMHENYRIVYARKVFEMKKGDSRSKFGLAIRYDEGFVAYLNGKEIVRRNVNVDKDGKITSENRGEIDSNFSFYPASAIKELLVDGENVLALEGYNREVGSSDFILDPFLIRKEN
jgi:hypothetical protein